MKVTKTMLKTIFLLGLFVSVGFSANEFGEAQNIISQADTAGKGVLGTGLKWFLALILPLGCMGGATILAYTQQKKESRTARPKPK
ncbi:hypothetical protein [Helicobacter labetoulli]|uniref:hypothetical protein n=1 Tax=Helicobacter labetoulli TaxID=2315333 RepID=UPI000EF68442|nr:hypothetical protein [Helicobacter labetoulli]